MTWSEETHPHHREEDPLGLRTGENEQRDQAEQHLLEGVKKKKKEKRYGKRQPRM